MLKNLLSTQDYKEQRGCTCHDRDSNSDVLSGVRKLSNLKKSYNCSDLVSTLIYIQNE